MGQHTEHTRYRCPCGAGSILLTTTSFGAGGSRKLHTQLVRCPGCQGQLAFRLEQSPDGKMQAVAEDLRSHERYVLVEWPEPV